MPRPPSRCRKLSRSCPTACSTGKIWRCIPLFRGLRGCRTRSPVLAEPSVFGLLAIAFAQIGQGQLPAAVETYRRWAVDAQGASYMAAGLGDMAMYEGRYSEAAKILGSAAAADVKAEEPDRAAAKFVALAYAHLLRRQPPAIAAAEKALDPQQDRQDPVHGGRILSRPVRPAGPRSWPERWRRSQPAGRRPMPRSSKAHRAQGADGKRSSH